MGLRISQCTEDVVGQTSTQSIFWGVALIASGILGGSLLLSAASVNLVIAWSIVLAGMAHLIIAHRAHRGDRLIWRLMIGFACVFFGVYLIASVLGETSLALVLAPLFLFEGIFDIAMFLRLRGIAGSSWVLLDGVVTLILGLMIYMQWPSSAARVIGMLVSVSLVTSGLTGVMLSLGHGGARARRSRDDSAAKEYWKIHG